MRHVCIGIDESYTRTGISVAIDGKLDMVNSISFRGCRIKPDKRLMLSNIINRLILKYKQGPTQLIIIVERIRTFSHSEGKPQFISTNYIKSTGALIATIVDTAYKHGVKVFSVDTRSWKSKIVGSSKRNKSLKGKDAKKLETTHFVEKLGFKLTKEIIVSRGKNKGQKKVVYNDDAADSACIALYGFLPRDQRILRLEQ